VAKALAKELKQPDEFVSFWTHFGAKLSQHRRKVIGTVVVAAIALAAGWGSVSYRESQAAKATVAFARIERIASADLLPEKPADKAGEKSVEDAKAAKLEKTEDNSVPRFKTEQERLEAANKEADAFLAAFGGEGLGRKAIFGKASRLLALGKTADAATLYATLAANEPNPDLRAMQLEGSAAASEAAGKLDDALNAYATLVDQSQRGGSFYLDRALFAKARILEKQGKVKDAEQALRDILTRVPKTSLRPQIDDRLAVFGEK
jgi:type IV secretory pathway VirB10-like protein